MRRAWFPVLSESYSQSACFLLPEAKHLALLRPANRQATVIGKLVSGQPDWLTTVEDRGDNVRRKEAEPDDAGDLGSGDIFGGSEFSHPEPLGHHAVAQMLGA